MFVSVSQQTPGECIIHVADNGIGFDPAYGLQIFEPFKRLHGYEYAGSGIGLAICSRIVKQYGGRIWAESVPGEGSTFSFSIPVASCHPIGNRVAPGVPSIGIAEAQPPAARCLRPPVGRSPSA